MCPLLQPILIHVPSEAAFFIPCSSSSVENGMSRCSEASEHELPPSRRVGIFMPCGWGIGSSCMTIRQSGSIEVRECMQRELLYEIRFSTPAFRTWVSSHFSFSLHLLKIATLMSFGSRLIPD